MKSRKYYLHFFKHSLLVVIFSPLSLQASEDKDNSLWELFHSAKKTFVREYKNNPQLFDTLGEAGINALKNVAQHETTNANNPHWTDIYFSKGIAFIEDNQETISTTLSLAEGLLRLHNELQGGHYDSGQQVPAFASVKIPDCRKEQIEIALEYAALVEANGSKAAGDAQLEGYQILSYLELPRALQKYFVHEKNGQNIQLLKGFGLNARIYQPLYEKRLIVAFQGTEPDAKRETLRSAINWVTNGAQGIGLPSEAYDLALEWAEILITAYEEWDIEFTGISLGGGLAGFIGVMTQRRAIAFNAPKLGTHYQNLIESLHEGNPHVDWVLYVNIKDEILNHSLNFIPGVRYGEFCAIEPHNDDLHLIEKHYTEHLVPSLEAALKDFY
ncbi:MAG TPA: hypothetical protein DIU37_01545 [Opitutae bacterium]|nr:hypothetical protein [Opitutae bacterium]|tara:strand:- start:5542 stop:6699 length:1158 start_codon:yes stop_codon:yes gene_type:complete